MAEGIPGGDFTEVNFLLVQSWTKSNGVDELLAPGWVGSLEVQVVKLLLVLHVGLVLRLDDGHDAVVHLANLDAFGSWVEQLDLEHEVGLLVLGVAFAVSGFGALILLLLSLEFLLISVILWCGTELDLNDFLSLTVL